MKKTSGEIELALFPIPGMVAFPFSTTSLHVFEPRYRLMIKDSIAAGRRIGVAHTQKKLSDKKLTADAPLEKILNSNQENYLAYPIFSGGFARIQETLEDGRLLVEIEMDSRYRMIDEIQQIPYKIVTCEPFTDEMSLNENSMRESLDATLSELVLDQENDLKNILQSDDWKKMSLEEYSFKIYSIVGFEPDIMQKILELRSPGERVQFLNDVLTRGPVQ